LHRRHGGGNSSAKGAIDEVLANRVYLGEAVHKGIAYPGEHVAIIDQRAWDNRRTVAGLRPGPRCLHC
jgi:site-specific DNA recombinase